MKWPLTWGKGENVSDQPILPGKFLNLIMERRNIIQLYLKKHHDFLCQIFAKWNKIILKNLWKSVSKIKPD